MDGIPTKLLLEIVEQISIPLAKVFNLSLNKGVVPFEWKEANIIPLFKKGSRNKVENDRPVNYNVKGKELIIPLHKTIVRPDLKYCI